MTIHPRSTGGRGASHLPPNWLLAPHLRPLRREAIPGQPRAAPPPRPSKPSRKIPFPAWCDEKGAPLATLLGPPCWR
ncbi:hypothetical protein [Sphingomonas sp. Root710]|uniref:hypothetical protein n=1 Tax=Sphingomonas sp. Root710 TaxID=1736594 RepID=UPI000A446F51|nr:hypothetical protein [Sphingomonas sp. Root710]